MTRNILRRAATNHPQKIYPPFDVLMEEAGFDAVYTVIEQMGGATVYVPTMRKVFYDCLAAEAYQEYWDKNFVNIAGVARKYGFSERALRNIVSKMK